MTDTERQLAEKLLNDRIAELIGLRRQNQEALTAAQETVTRATATLQMIAGALEDCAWWAQQFPQKQGPELTRNAAPTIELYTAGKDSDNGVDFAGISGRPA